MSEAEVISEQVEVPVEVLCHGDVGLFLLIPLDGVNFSKDEEIASKRKQSTANLPSRNNHHKSK